MHPTWTSHTSRFKPGWQRLSLSLSLKSKDRQECLKPSTKNRLHDWITMSMIRWQCQWFDDNVNDSMKMSMSRWRCRWRCDVSTRSVSDVSDSRQLHAMVMEIIMRLIWYAQNSTCLLVYHRPPDGPMAMLLMTQNVTILRPCDSWP